ncbi:hypothetical protein CDL15_Pgr007206 [Punica granatum]|uniref:Bromo domain-containing protein n=1 Tax=Punica granatum TaxID=22663 RepID=A0A218X7G2_PUNGR|nr:hypothetical protein CDL15_Pgr007206 [Punica granatum]
MGKGAETTAKKKKKGRPSLLDIQKRILKQQRLQETLTGSPNSHHQPPDATPNPSRRSTRRNSISDGLYPSSEWVSGAEEDDDDDERIRKKRKPLFGLDSPGPNSLADSPFAGLGPCGSDSNPRSGNHDADAGSGKPSVGSEYSGEKVLKGTDTGGHGSVDVSGPTTPLPDKKLLAFILDRLQKKDTHGVFSEPVDPEELPDYHDIIKHPMDFGTVRKKLEDGAYANLEQFEKDVFLICSNAMQYNSPDTIFFRQARSMQEIAKKDFENLRQDSDDSEPQQTKVVRRGRPPGRGLKKLLEKSSADRAGPEASSDAVLANGDNSCSSNTYNLRKGPDPCHLHHADSIGNASRVNRESQSYWFAEFDKEFPGFSSCAVASVLRSVMKEGKKLCPADENKRDSYKQQSTGGERSLLCTFESETKYLTVVDLRSQDHGYARSLARFAANLGPVVWRIASKKIRSVLPNGTNFGPGWVGEDDILERPQFPFSQRQNIPSAYDCPSRVASPAGLNFSVEDIKNARRLASQSKLASPSNSSCESCDIKQMNQANTNCFGGKSGIVMQNMPSPISASYEALVPSEAPGMVSSGYRAIQPMPINYVDSTNSFSQSSSGLQPFNSFRSHTPSSEELSWNLPVQHMECKPDCGQIPPDPNARFLVQGSPSSSLFISSQQPDLGLQL